MGSRGHNVGRRCGGRRLTPFLGYLVEVDGAEVALARSARSIGVVGLRRDVGANTVAVVGLATAHLVAGLGTPETHLVEAHELVGSVVGRSVEGGAVEGHGAVEDELSELPPEWGGREGGWVRETKCQRKNLRE
eukprot:Tamp_22397.p1 GENE.Tamp_22397~~Tamp_22397.p1  ORF type:complete len:134 (+),score=9.38 Tamp_22397:575-976(+)